jgi:antitoxin ParD1/3/4
MSTIEKISVSLPAERITDVRAAIAAGDFATTSEVLRDGLRDWKLKRKVHAMGVQERRALWNEGAADNGAEDGEAVFARMTAKDCDQANRGEAWAPCRLSRRAKVDLEAIGDDRASDNPARGGDVRRRLARPVPPDRKSPEPSPRPS